MENKLRLVRREASILRRVVGEYHYYFRNLLQRKHRDMIRGCHEFIPMDPRSLVFRFIAIDEYIKSRDGIDNVDYCLDYDKRPIKFLDAGCGMGNILLIAEALNWQPSGVEIDPKYVKIARDVLGSRDSYFPKRANVHMGDLLKYTGYRKFDVIYYWSPMYDHDMLKRFTERLGNMMKIGAIVLPCGYDRRFRSDDFRNLGGIDSHLNGAYEKVGRRKKCLK
jgi:SAM-dependent methyltransferase